jgi:hypothetical protein
MQFVPVVDANQNPLMPTTANRAASEKRCSKCKQWKSREDFYTHPLHKDGLQSQCKACWKERRALPISRRKRSVWRYKDHRKDPRKVILQLAKHRAKRDQLPFNLVVDDIIVPERCPILGIDLHVSDGKPSNNSPTLDKYLPELGYVKGNVAVISHRANAIKNNASVEELKSIIRYIQRGIGRNNGRKDFVARHKDRQAHRSKL